MNMILQVPPRYLDDILAHTHFVVVEDGQPCIHKGCELHAKHPCEVCGRRVARGNVLLFTSEQRNANAVKFAGRHVGPTSHK